MTETSVVIAGVEVTSDQDGRYSLNALHRAYERDQGSLQPDKAPGQWTRTKQSQEFVSEVEKQTMQICIVSEGGRNGGTFAHELIAVEYAGWLSPRFRIMVNQAFIDSRKNSAPKTPGEALVEMAQNYLRHERQIMALQHQQVETSAQVKALVDGEDYWTIVGYGNLIGEHVDLKRSQKLGRIASRICRERGWHKSEANHPVFGSIGSYPRQAVALAFDQEAA